MRRGTERACFLVCLKGGLLARGGRSAICYAKGNNAKRICRIFVSTSPSESIKNKASNLTKEDTVYSFVPPSTSTKNNLSLVFDFSPIFNIFERLLSNFPFFPNAGRRALLLPRDGEGPERRRVHPRFDGGAADLQRRLGHRAPGERDLRHPPLLRGRPIREFTKKNLFNFLRLFQLSEFLFGRLNRLLLKTFLTKIPKRIACQCCTSVTVILLWK